MMSKNKKRKIFLIPYIFYSLLKKITYNFFLKNEISRKYIEKCDICVDKYYGFNTHGSIKVEGFFNFDYLPTPYVGLRKLFNYLKITEKDVFLDYGCGMGRILQYANLRGCENMVGVEFDENLYKILSDNTEDNKNTQTSNYDLICEKAQKYTVRDDISMIYYANPFGVKILAHTLKRIMESYERSNRKILLIFHSPINDYINYLNSLTNIRLEQTIRINDSFYHGFFVVYEVQ